MTGSLTLVLLMAVLFGAGISIMLERSLTRARKRSRVLRIDLQGLTKVIESPPRVASLEE